MATSLKHSKTYPLPRTDFLFLRRGPWPQPAPDHPMAMAAEVLHPPKSEVKDWDRTAGWNYQKALITKLPLALYNWFIHNQIDLISDDEFSEILTTTTYSKYLRRRSADVMNKTNFRDELGPFDSPLGYLTMDFTPMQDIEPFKGMYAAPTITLFGRNEDGTASDVIAISIGHFTGDGWRHIVLTPKDGNAWTLAKYFVLQGAAHMVVLSGHPATHFPYDTVNAVTQSAVPTHHTLFKLLQPHLRLQLAVDHAVLEGGHSVVSESRGEFYAPFVGPGTDIRQLVAAGYVGYPHPLSKYGNKEPYLSLVRPYLEDEGHVPFPLWSYPTQPRDIPSDFGRFLKAYYQTVQNYVAKVVDHIFTMEGTEKGEEELYYIKCWARYISHWLHGFPNEHEILEKNEQGKPQNLITAITTFIWDVSVAHSLDHRAFGVLGPHLTPFRIRMAPPDSKTCPVIKRSKILSGWDMFKSTLGFEMFFKPHNVELLKDLVYDFESETLKAAAEAFVEELHETEKQLISEGVDVGKYAPLDEIAGSIQY